MKNNIVPFLVLLFCLSQSFKSNSQNIKIDSLNNELKKWSNKAGFKADTNVVNIFNALAFEYFSKGSDSAFIFSEKALKLSRKCKWKTGEAKTLSNSGYIFANTYNNEKARTLFRKSLKLYKELKNNNKIGGVYLNIAVTYSKDYSKDTSRSYYLKAVKYLKLAKDTKWLPYTYNNLAISYFDELNYDLALKYFTLAFEVSKNANDKGGMVAGFTNIGTVYDRKNDFNNALLYYTKGQKIAEKYGLHRELTYILNGIGDLYSSQNNLSNAMHYYNKALRESKYKMDEAELVHSYSKLGTVYADSSILDSARYYYNKGLSLSIKTHDKSSEAYFYIYIGNLMIKKNELDSSLKCFEKALILREEIGDESGISNCFSNIGHYYFLKKDYVNSLRNFKKSQEIAAKFNILEILNFNYEHLSKIYFELQEFEKSLDCFKKHIKLRDSVESDNKKKLLLQKEMQYRFDKKSGEDSMMNARKNEIQAREIKNQQVELKAKRNQQYALFGGLSLVVVFSIFMYNRFRVTQKQKKIIEEKEKETQHQKEIIEEKHKEITDSINYAKRIQEAILPSRFSLTENLKNGFVLYKPKDIVAGDFYWLENYAGKIFFAAADCTGHGVPGAMVSVVCSNALSKSLLEEGITETGKILDRTRELVIEKFSKSEENVKDGMDISLCKLDINGLNLQWSGANNPLWVIRNDELKEIKPDKQPIGKTENPSPFTTHNLDLQKGDTIYIFTDGYQDQFGGKDGKKFKAAKLKELLLSIQNQKMDKQKEIILEAFEKWKGNLEQVDDVCIIGIKI